MLIAIDQKINFEKKSTNCTSRQLLRKLGPMDHSFFGIYNVTTNVVEFLGVLSLVIVRFGTTCMLNHEVMEMEVKCRSDHCRIEIEVSLLMNMFKQPPILTEYINIKFSTGHNAIEPEYDDLEEV